MDRFQDNHHLYGRTVRVCDYPLMPFQVMGFTSGTTRGTSGSILHWLELSITTQPDFTATGAHIFDLSPPAEKRAISIPLNEFLLSVSTGTSLSRYVRVFPFRSFGCKKSQLFNRELSIFQYGYHLFAYSARGTDNSDYIFVFFLKHLVIFLPQCEACA